MKSTPTRLLRSIEWIPRAALWRRTAAHLADCELAFGWRLRIMFERRGAPLWWFDEDNGRPDSSTGR